MDYGDQLVKVRYIGKGDMISTEYNGKRYAFGKAKPVSIIPIAVLRNIIQSGALFAGEIIPYTDPQQQVALQAELEGRPAPAPEPPAAEEGPGEEESAQSEDPENKAPEEPPAPKKAQKKRRRKRKD